MRFDGPISANPSEPELSLEVSDDFQPHAPPARHCPGTLLAVFAREMHAHGRRVNTLLMLADPEYALWQLACARALNDPSLSSLAVQLFGYLGDAPCPSAFGDTE